MQSGYREQRGPRGRTAMDAAAVGANIEEVRRWAQLKVQGCFSRGGRGHHGEPLPCRLCDSGVPETAVHLLLDCPGALALEAAVVGQQEGWLGRAGGAAWAQLVLGGVEKRGLRNAVRYVAQIAKAAETALQVANAKAGTDAATMVDHRPQSDEEDEDASSWSAPSVGSGPRICQPHLLRGCADPWE